MDRIGYCVEIYELNVALDYSNIRGGVTTEIAVALYNKKESNFGIFGVKSFLRGIKSTFTLHRK